MVVVNHKLTGMDAPPLEVLTYPHVRKDLSKVIVAVITNVTNSSKIRSRIIAAASAEGREGDEERERLNFAFIDAKTVSPKMEIYHNHKR